MKRKNFISNSSLLCLSLTFSPVESNAGEAIEQNSADNFELSEITIDELQRQMQEGKLSSRSITEMYLKRIAAIDKNGIALRTVIELNPNALKEAAHADDERRAGQLRGAMHGIPVLVKDNIDTTDMTTTAGSLAMEGYKPKQDAFIIRQLRAAGAVILGKTNLSEWANIRSEHSSSGWSSRGGQTKNPYILDRNPVGSSSGSAVGTAANLCVVAVGTETDGSIVAPASANGVVGIKPTVGLLSRAGIIPVSQTQDTAGALARTVKDAAILLQAMAGVDGTDEATLKSKDKAATGYAQLLSADGLEGKRIGIEKNWRSNTTGINRLYHDALEQMQKAGAVLVEIQFVREFGRVGDAEFQVLKSELKDGLNRYLAKANAPVKSLSDIIAFNQKNEARTMPFFKQDIFESAEQTTGLQSEVYLNALARCREAVKALDGLFAENKLDAISGITIGPACSTDLIYGDRYGDVNFASPAAIAGYPHITLPCGFIYKLPIGLSFFGQAWSEALILNIAYAYENITKARSRPKFLETFPV